MPSRDATLLEALDRHARRRGEGIPTLSVLVGPPEQTLALWTQWARHHQLPVVDLGAQSASEMVTAWALALARERDLTAEAEAYVVLRFAASGAHRELTFRGKTLHERRVLLDGLPLPTTSPEVWELSRLLLEAPAAESPGMLPEALHQRIAQAPEAALSALMVLAPAGHVPALHTGEHPSLFQSLRTLTGLCAAAPGLTAACILSPEAFFRCIRQAESRVVAMMREGRLDLDASAPPLPQLSTVVPTLARMQQEGMPEPVLTLYAEAAQAMNAAYGPQAEDRARSAAERFLFEQLRCSPATQGLFELNVRLKLAGQKHPLEVDLLCRELKLAVEIDGYYHFQNRDAYRRDRNKDVALQRAGYWVLRVLAEDVVDRLEFILSTLTRLVDERKRRRLHLGDDE